MPRLRHVNPVSRPCESSSWKGASAADFQCFSPLARAPQRARFAPSSSPRLALCLGVETYSMDSTIFLSFRRAWATEKLQGGNIGSSTENYIA